MMAVLNNVVDSPVMHRIIQWMLPYRLLINIVIHTMLIVTSYFYSLLFFNGLLLDRYLVDMFVVTVWPLLLIRLAVFHYYGLFTGMWRFVSLGDVVKIIHAVIISTLLVYGLSLVWDRIFIVRSGLSSGHDVLRHALQRHSPAGEKFPGGASGRRQHAQPQTHSAIGPGVQDSADFKGYHD